MIEVTNLHKSFDGVKVINGITFKVENGEILALIGGSGQGKSVLLKHIAGLMKPDQGHILIDGQEIGKLRGKALSQLRSRLGFLFQGGALFDSMTVFDNVAFPLREKSKMGEAEIRRRVVGELEQVGLSGQEHKYPSQLSGGMMKRAALVRELIWEPEIMFFDEPTAGLDPIIGHTIMNLIDRLHDRYDFTGIIVTHEIPQVFEIVNKVAMIHDGTLIAEGTPMEIISSGDPVVQQFIKGEVEGPITYM